MDGADGVWEYLSQLLNDYSGFFYLFLLTPLFLGAAALLGLHLVQRRRGDSDRMGAAVKAGMVLLALFVAGLLFNVVNVERMKQKRAAFIAAHQAPPGEHWLQVVDFALPPGRDAKVRKRHDEIMARLVAAMSAVMSEDLPEEEFGKTRVLRIAGAKGPWKSDPIGEHNYEDVLREIRGFGIIWGSLPERGTRATVFLGIPRQLSGEVETTIPLYDFTLKDDPRSEQQFGDGYYILLGLAGLGIALDTYRQAQQATGEPRRRQFLQAVLQFNNARRLANNRRSHPSLQSTLYGGKIDRLIERALREAGLG